MRCRFFAMLTALLLIFLLPSQACGENEGTALTDGAPSAASAEASVFPQAYTAYDSEYSFTGYAFYPSADSFLIVRAYGEGYQAGGFTIYSILFKPKQAQGKRAGVNGQFLPAWCECVYQGEKYDEAYISVHDGYVSFRFQTDYFTPDSITLYNAETGEVIVTFDCVEVPQVE